MKIQSPWMGRIKGSAGNMTGCKVYDKNVMRAKAFEVSNPNTAAQQVQRGYFADLIELVAEFSPEQLRTLFPNKPKSMSRRNALAKQLDEYKTMEGNEKVIDFANIDTLGNAPTYSANISEPTYSEQGVMAAGIDFSEIMNDFDTNLQQCIVIINVTKKEILMSSQLIPCDERTGISIPFNWEENDEYKQIPLLTNTTDPNASFGNFIIKARPGKMSN